MVEDMAEEVVAFIKTVIPPDFMAGPITILLTCLVEVQVSFTDKLLRSVLRACQDTSEQPMQVEKLVHQLSTRVFPPLKFDSFIRSSRQF